MRAKGNFLNAFWKLNTMMIHLMDVVYFLTAYHFRDELPRTENC